VPRWERERISRAVQEFMRPHQLCQFFACLSPPRLGITFYVKRVLAAVLVALLLCPAIPASVRAQTTEADVYVAQAIIDFEEKRYPDALENLRKASELEPDHVEALYYTGVIAMTQGRTPEAIAPLERARAKAPGDPSVAFQLGLAYFGQQQYDKAQPLLEEVFRGQPTLDGLGYYVGFMRYRKKDYRNALAAFRAGRSADPELQQLTRLYSGLTLAVLGLPTQAAAEVEQSLRLAPGSALTGPSERLRDTIAQARSKEKRLAIDLRFGFLYDDNVRVTPDPSNQEPIVRPLLHPKRDSPGEVAGVNINYTFFRTDSWDASAGYSFFGTYYNDLTSFNTTDHLVNFGLTHKTALSATFPWIGEINMPAQLGAQYAFDVLYLREDQFIQRHTGTVYAAVVENDLLLTQAFMRYQRKDFTEPDIRPPREEIRDADNYMVGFVQLFRFEEDRHFIKLGYQFDYEETSGKNYEYRGHRLTAGGQYTLPWQGIRLKYDMDAHIRGYVHKNSLLPTVDETGVPGSGQDKKRRRDHEITHVMRVEWPLPWKPRLFDRDTEFVLAGEHQNTGAHSNIQVFDYDRRVTSLILSWSF
jgi:tetratricopeptide (TPR) repeat protein